MRRYILVCALALLIAPRYVSAHSKLVESNPADGATLKAAPADVTLKFDDELQAAGLVLTVTDAAGSRVDAGDGALDLNDVDHKTMHVGLKSGLGAGAYTVAWTVIGDDGHEVGGSISFTVEGAAPAATPAPVATPPSVSLPATGAPAGLPLILATGLAVALLLLGRRIRHIAH